ncbi:MAG: hypothetical protein R3A47_06205 [Polyangiales bacterium]
MFIPKKTIPKLAITGLALTAIGCGDDAASTETTKLEQLNAKDTLTCEFYQACGWFEEGETVESCVADLGNDPFTQADLDAYGSDCVDALISYYNCVLSLSCDEYAAIETDGLAGCQDEFDAAESLCPAN